VFTQGDPAVEGSVFRDEALVVAELGTVSRAEDQKACERAPFRGNVALFTDSLGGMGGVAAKRLVRDGYAVRLYCVGVISSPLDNASENADDERIRHRPR
jgi:hypothetical protein